MFTIIQETILIAGSLIGAATDAKTGYIYDWITIPMIIIGLILSIIQQQWINLILGVVLFGTLYFFYKMGKIGGGDVKLFTAIALLNPTNNIYFLFSGIIVACAGAIIFYSTYFTIKYLKKGINFEENRKGIQKATIFGLFLMIYFIILLKFNLMKLTVIIMMGLLCIFGLVFVALQEGIKKNFFEKKIKLSQIEEGEVLAEDSNSKKIIKLMKGKKLIEEKEAKMLKKNKIKEIIVLRDLPPFGPFITLGVIIATINPTIAMILFI